MVQNRIDIKTWNEIKKIWFKFKKSGFFILKIKITIFLHPDIDMSVRTSGEYILNIVMSIRTSGEYIYILIISLMIYEYIY